MRVLFDQGTPAPLRQLLRDHDVVLASEKGWGTLKNGDLLRAAEGEFDLLITTDQSLRYQQNLAGRRLRVLVLTTTSWPRIRPHADLVARVIQEMTPGEYRELLIPQ